MKHVSVLRGADGGKYPDGNSVIVRGREESVLIDPSLSIADAADPPRSIDRVLISHCHEDHLAGLFRFAAAPVHVHRDDRVGLESLDGLMTIYGMAPVHEAPWRREVVERFHYAPRPDAHAFSDGDVFDLGGTTLTAVHLPGHTRGHSGFFVEPDGVMLLADIDLTGFGPYYGDAWSSIDDFERSLRRCRDIDARQYVTFHHKGTIEGRDAFRALLADYAAVIGRREQTLLGYLDRPLTVDDIVARRFVYRPHVQLIFVEPVERRSAELHLARLLASGAVKEVEPGRFLRAA